MQKIHIVTFQVPYPADYGGVIDVYYKSKALTDAGCHVVLHCFCYDGRGTSDQLSKCATEVYLYERHTGLISNLSLSPYIVRSRVSKHLLERLMTDDAPILFEGLHCTSLLSSPELRNRKKMVRCHNVEHEYYGALARSASSWSKRLFYNIEAARLRHYEPSLRQAQTILAITESDRAHFAALCPDSDVQLLPCFHAGDANDSLATPRIKKDFILFHGSLNVEENIVAAEHLLQCVIPNTNRPWIIAGRSPSEDLQRRIKQVSNAELVANPSDSEMERLLRESKANVLITNQATGIKLKLLNALSQGGFCIVNEAMVANTGLEGLCEVCRNDEELISAIRQLDNKSFSHAMQEERSVYLAQHYDNKRNVQKIIDLF